jgi:hypothetical protein
MAEFSSSSSSIVITSLDIERSKFSDANLLELRKQFESVDDQTLARFLIARNDDLEKAKALLIPYLQWKDSGAYPVLKSTCLKEFNKGKCYSHGVDLFGHPLFIWHSCRHTANDRDIDELSRTMVWWMEYMNAKFTPDRSKYTVLIDRSNFKNENSDIELVKKLGKLFQVINNLFLIIIFFFLIFKFKYFI